MTQHHNVTEEEMLWGLGSSETKPKPSPPPDVAALVAALTRLNEDIRIAQELTDAAINDYNTEKARAEKAEAALADLRKLYALITAALTVRDKRIAELEAGLTTALAQIKHLYGKTPVYTRLDALLGGSHD